MLSPSSDHIPVARRFRPDSKESTMVADAPKDPLATYDPSRSSWLRPEPPRPEPSVEPTVLQDIAEAERPAVKGGPPTSSESFLLTEPLAQGGLGDVWVGVQRSLDRVVAVKRLREDRLAEATTEQQRRLEEMFRQEALTTARLEHPNIVPVYALGSDPLGQAQLGMKLVRGRPWEELIEEARDLPLGESLNRHLPILIDVAQAVAYAHSQGILHRDIKPQQVMVGEFGEVLLMDWGLAVPFGQVSEAVHTAPSSATSSGATTIPGPAGTPSFMAPEQARGHPEELGPWTDVYLLGSTLYYLLTGSPPHRAKNGLLAMAKAAQGEVETPSERAPHRRVPRELCELAMGAMAPRPEDRRPSTVADLIEALQGYLTGATRRQQSKRLTFEVEEQLESSRATAYGELGHSLSRLREAESLWLENPSVLPLRRRVLEDFAEVALQRGDLTLARLQAEELPEGGEKIRLLQRIDRALDRQRSSEKQRRRSLRALAATLLLLFLGGLHYLLEQRRAGERLRLERDAARQARAEAEGLMTFMLEDLWVGLLAIDRTDLLTPVARRAASYYGARDLKELTPRERVHRGKTFDVVADALQRQGDIEAAVVQQRRAMEVFAALLEEEPRNSEHLIAYLTAAEGLTWFLRDLGRAEEASEVYEQIEGRCREALATAPEDFALQKVLLQIHDGAGIVHYDRGDLSAAEERFWEAVEIGRRVREQGGGELINAYLSQALFHHAVVLLETDRAAQALVFLQESIQIFRHEFGEDLDHNPFLTGLTQALEARALAAVGRLDEGLESLRNLVPKMERALDEDPANVERRYLLAQAHLELGHLEDMANRRGAARRSWQRVVDLVGPLRDSSENLYLLDGLVRALFLLGRVEEARPVAERLLASDWTHNGFVKLCGLHGVHQGLKSLAKTSSS